MCQSTVMLRKLPIVAIFGHGSGVSAERGRLASAAGALVARLGAHLLTGAGYGVMAAAAEGFVAVTERQGLSIGIVPCQPDGPFDVANRDPDGRAYPNPFIKITVMTPLPPRSEAWRTTPTRNHVNVLTANAILALPGNAGTRNELTMAAFYRGESARRPDERHTVLLGPAEEFTQDDLSRFVHAANLTEAEDHLRRILSRRSALPTVGAMRDRVET